MPLIELTDRGFYCPPGKFYIDPWKPVDKAVITHAHSDHARPGSDHYLCHPMSAPLLRLRLGDTISLETMEWGHSRPVNDVKISLHPAGHIIGSSQVRIEYKGEVWVVSGDYKTENDGISGQFEAVPCHTFITESTFGLPIYRWKPQQELFTQIRNWISANQAAQQTSVLLAYSLGKAQRIMQAVQSLAPAVYLHGAVWNVHQALVSAGHVLPAAIRIIADTPREELKNAIVIAPPGADGTAWMKRFAHYKTAICSGWMQVRGNVRRRNADAGFAISDHADWNGLLEAVSATGAQRVLATHGFQSAFSRFLSEKGIEAAEVKTEFGTEEEEQLANLPAEENKIAP